MRFMAEIRNILKAFYRKPLVEHTLNLKNSLLLHRVLTIVYGILTCRFFWTTAIACTEIQYNTLRFKGRFSPRRLVYFFPKQPSIRCGTVEPGYNDIGLYYTSSTASDILQYQLIPHC